MIRDKERIYEYIRLYQRVYAGLSPSFRDIGEYFGLSTSQVSYAVDALKRDGKLQVRLDDASARSLSVVNGFFLTEDELVRAGADLSVVRGLLRDSLQRMGSI